jgi:drug/metabolite transporter (DMT)-like permease
MVAVTLFALSSPLTRAVTPAIDPLLLGMRVAAASFAAIPLILIFRLKGPRDAHSWLLLAISAGGSFLAFPILFTLGQAQTSATHGALIQAALPIFTGLAAAIVERRRLGNYWWLGAALAFAGEGVLELFRDSGSTTERASTLSGDLLILLASALTSGAYIAGARLAARISALNATLWCVSAAGLTVMPFAAIRAVSVPWGSFGLGMWASLATLAFGPTLIAFIAWYWALSRGGVRRVALFQFLVPPLSVLIAVVFLGESLTVPLVISLAAILGGIAIARRSAS